MANKIIIHVGDDITDEMACRYVAGVIHQGRQSNGGTAYCYVAEFYDGTIVLSDRTQTTDTFRVRKAKVIQNDL